MNSAHDGGGPPPGFWRSRHALGLIVFGAAAAYFLLTEHLAHVIGALPYLLLLACPLMHLFMHRGHGGHPHGGSHDKPDAPGRPGSGN
ncbi:MAG: DUF2933 domain-containing protein [Pseudomonadota bacterium]